MWDLRLRKLLRRSRLAFKQTLKDPKAALRLAATVLRSDRRDAFEQVSAWLGGMACTATARDYAAWRESFDTLTEQDRDAIRQRCRSMSYRPLLSIVMPTYQSNIKYLKAAIASVQSQFYDNWELCVADDASPDTEIRRVLEDAAAQDDRLKIVFRQCNGNISEASNSALDMASGEFIVLMDHDDIIPPHALYIVAEDLNNNDSDILYSDEDKIDENDIHYSPHFKMGWNPDILVSQNMISHLGVYRTALVRQVGGFRPGLEGSQDHDLALRVADASSPGRIRHLPWVLYHWRVFRSSTSFSTTQGGRAASAARQAVTDHLKHRDEEGVVSPSSHGYISVRRTSREPRPLVSLCGLSGLGGLGVTEEELLALRGKTDWPKVEILAGKDALSLAAQARGAVLVFLDRPVNVATPAWLDPLVAHLQRTDVGVVGPAVIRPDGNLDQGPLMEADGVLSSPFAGKPWDSAGYFGRLHLPQQCFSLQLTGLATRRDTILEEAVLESGDSFADLPSIARYCLALRRKNLATVWEPGEPLKVIKPGTFKNIKMGSDSAWDGANFSNPCLSKEDGSFMFREPRGRTLPWTASSVQENHRTLPRR